MGPPWALARVLGALLPCLPALRGEEAETPHPWPRSPGVSVQPEHLMAAHPQEASWLTSLGFSENAGYLRTSKHSVFWGVW